MIHGIARIRRNSFSTVHNGKASKNSVFISRHALASGSSNNGRPTVASAMRLVNLRANAADL